MISVVLSFITAIITREHVQLCIYYINGTTSHWCKLVGFVVDWQVLNIVVRILNQIPYYRNVQICIQGRILVLWCCNYYFVRFYVYIYFIFMIYDLDICYWTHTDWLYLRTYRIFYEFANRIIHFNQDRFSSILYLLFERITYFDCL